MVKYFMQDIQLFFLDLKLVLKNYSFSILTKIIWNETNFFFVVFHSFDMRFEIHMIHIHSNDFHSNTKCI